MKTVCSCGHTHECLPAQSTKQVWMTEIVPIPRPPTIVMSLAEFEQLLINGGISPAEAKRTMEEVQKPFIAVPSV